MVKIVKDIPRVDVNSNQDEDRKMLKVDQEIGK